MSPDLNIFTTDSRKLWCGWAKPKFGMKPITTNDTNQVRGGGGLDYIQTISLHILERRDLRGKRHCHSWAMFLHAAIKRSTLGVSSQMTTSYRCFQSSQQQRRIRVDLRSWGTPGGCRVPDFIHLPDVFHPPSNSSLEEFGKLTS